VTLRWKIPLLALVVLILVVAGYAAYIYVRAGQLKSIEPHFAGTCRRVPGAVGAEDITIHPGSGIAYIASDDRRATVAGRPVPGALFAYDLSDPLAVPRNLTPSPDAGFHPHGIGLWAERGGRTLLFVVNHPGASLFGDNPVSGPPHTIEIFEHRSDGRLVHRRRIASEMLISPNDIAPVGEDRFYVTNDHGSAPGFEQKLEDYLRLARASVLYFDGERFTEVAGGLRFANGIAVSRDGERVYVATLTSFSVTVFAREATTGALSLDSEIDVDTGPDNIELDPEGGLWIGAHPKLLSFVSHAEDAGKLSPSQVLHLTPGEQGSFTAKEVFLSRGDDLSGSSVAAWRDGRLLIGSVFEPHFLDCHMRR
jgi:arylesterase / paraoxonase